jgi:putative addiction module component (TIGR02574 family)
MKLKPDSIETHLLHLPVGERARLAELLLASLDAVDAEGVAAADQADVDAAWAAEAERRYAELKDGVVAGIPAEQIYAELRADLDALHAEQ